MKNRKMKNSTKAFAVFGIIALLAVSLVAADMFGNGVFSGEDKEELKAEREAVKNGDYNAWASTMQERVQAMQNSINEQTFEQIQERHAEMAEFREAAQDLREEYGIEGRGKGMGGGMMGNGLGHGNCPMAEGSEETSE